MRCFVFQRRLLPITLALFAFGCHASSQPDSAVHVGHSDDGVTVVPTRQLLHPAGRSVEFHGRPVDLVLSSDGRIAYVKSDNSIFAIDVRAGAVRQELKYPEKLGASLHGIVLARDGSRLYVTLAQSAIEEIAIASDGNGD